jgi:aminoglycoside 3-N-acetyltransferase I
MSEPTPSPAAAFRIVRLRSPDRQLAKQLFVVMARVFEEDCQELSDRYVDGPLKREEFWALAALSGEDVVGGLTTHTLPMTRTEVPEVFLYDLAVRTDRQRLGIGRQLVRQARAPVASVAALG